MTLVGLETKRKGSSTGSLHYNVKRGMVKEEDWIQPVKVQDEFLSTVGLCVLQGMLN